MTDHAPGALGRFLTPADAAEILNVPLPELMAVVESGELPSIRVGAAARLRIERTVLDAYIDAMYEESRRRSLWRQADFANIPELSGGTVIHRTHDAHPQD